MYARCTNYCCVVSVTKSIDARNEFIITQIRSTSKVQQESHIIILRMCPGLRVAFVRVSECIVVKPHTMSYLHAFHTRSWGKSVYAREQQQKSHKLLDMHRNVLPPSTPNAVRFLQTRKRERWLTQQAQTGEDLPTSWKSCAACDRNNTASSRALHQLNKPRLFFLSWLLSLPAVLCLFLFFFRTHTHSLQCGAAQTHLSL